MCSVFISLSTRPCLTSSFACIERDHFAVWYHADSQLKFMHTRALRKHFSNHILKTSHARSRLALCLCFSFFRLHFRIFFLKMLIEKEKNRYLFGFGDRYILSGSSWFINATHFDRNPISKSTVQKTVTCFFEAETVKNFAAKGQYPQKIMIRVWLFCNHFSKILIYLCQEQHKLMISIW